MLDQEAIDRLQAMRFPVSLTARDWGRVIGALRAVSALHSDPEKALYAARLATEVRQQVDAVLDKATKP